MVQSQAPDRQMPIPTPAVRRRTPDEVLAEVERVRRADGISLEALGRVIGRSGSTLSQVVSGKYAGDAGRVIKALAAWLEDAGHRSPGDVPFAATSVARRILTVCDLAVCQVKMGLVVTPSGSGKTAALREFSRQRPDRRLYLTTGELVTTKLGLLAELVARLGLEKALPRGATTYEKTRAVRDRLAALYSGGRYPPFVIIVDEATTLQPSALNLLRGLYDDPEVRAVVILADTWRLESALHSARGIPGGTEQLRSRCGAQYRMAVSGRGPAAISRADVQAIGRAVLGRSGFEGGLPDSSWTYLYGLVIESKDGAWRLRDGGLRNVVDRLDTCRDTAVRLGVEPTYSVAELDEVADLVGQTRQYEPTAGVFANRKPETGNWKERKTA